MKRTWLSSLLFIALSFLGALPTLMVFSYHSRKASRWEALNSQILKLKTARDHQQRILRRNALLTKNRSNIDPERLAAASEKIVFLQKETKRLQSLPKHSLLAQSKEVWARKHALSKAPHLQWNHKKIHQDLVFLNFSQAIEADTEDIKAIFHLLDSQNNPEAPLAFFTYWEMIRHTTPLNNEVWLIQAEAISRWI